ncbi:hypothetical protein F4777DRAFT_544639 [Nemania sp. FL0916]|nr:hypothetical protein F4777DRAFT_544639 [Nemania sp. FL0916]
MRYHAGLGWIVPVRALTASSALSNATLVTSRGTMQCRYIQIHAAVLVPVGDCVALMTMAWSLLPGYLRMRQWRP